MKKTILFVLILILTILLTSCSTQQRVVYRDCNCNTTTFRFGWNNNPYWGWNNPYWGWNSWNNYPFRMIPRYYSPSNRTPSPPPTRYQRRTSIEERPSRSGTYNDNTYPYRTPNIPRKEVRPTQQNNTPSRVQNSTPSRVQQRTTPSTTTQPPRRRSNNN